MQTPSKGCPKMGSLFAAAVISADEKQVYKLYL